MRARMRTEMESAQTSWENLCQLGTADGVLILDSTGRNIANTSVSASAKSPALNKDWIDAAMDLVLTERQRVGTIYFLMDEANVRLQLQQPWIKFGTDAGGIDPDSARGLTHPRAYGTFTRILGKYVRDEKVIPLEDAIRKMTSAVACDCR